VRKIAGKALDAIFSRRSTRKYLKKKMPEEDVKIIMEAGRRAPTDGSLQLWSAIRITDDGLREKIAQLVWQDSIAEASEFFVFLADLYRPKKFLESRGMKMGNVEEILLLFAGIDAALAAENMVIAATALGYGTCIIGRIQDAAEEIADILELPEKTFPLFGLTIGYPDEFPSLRPRLSLGMLFHENRYREYSDEEISEGIKAMSALGKDWMEIMDFYLGENGSFVRRNEVFKWMLKEKILES
jgi:nitroreductase